MQRAILDDFPQADIGVSIVWINMLPLDSQVTAETSARIIHDPRARHFHDPEKQAGKAVASSLGGQDKVAWDIYLFYAPGSEWGSNPPAPIGWAHQLEGSNWADSTHYRTGDDLVNELRKIMERLTNVRPKTHLKG